MKTRDNPFFRPARFVATLAIALTVLPAQAGSLFWDGTTSTADADGGNGTWNTALTNWDTFAAAGADSVWTNANNDTAVFSGAAGTVSLGAPITVGGLQFDTAGYLVQTNTLTFGVSGNIVTNANATINSSIAATSGLVITKTGSGTLTLGGNNTYAGNTTVSNGSLKAGATTALSANSAYSVGAGALLDLGGFNNTIKSLSTATGTVTNSTGNATLTISTMAATAQLFTGSLGLQVSGAQNTDFTNGNNTYSGGTLVGFNNGANNRILLNGRTLGVGTPGALTNGEFGTGAITLGVSATDRAQIYMAGTNTINNAIVVNTALGNTDNAGAFQIRATGQTINGAINANLADVTFQTASGTGGITLNGTISGSFGLTLLAGSPGATLLTVTLTNNGTANSYAGNTTISSVKETLTLGAANQLPNGAGKGNLIVTGGNFKMGGFSETINGLSGNGTVDGISGTPTLTVGDNDATGAANTFSGVIKNTAGTLALTKIGTGTLTLSGNNTYGGATTISFGTLKAGSITGLSASSATSVAAGATLDLGGFNNTIKSLSTSGGTITNSTGSGTLKIADAMSSTLNAHLFTGSLGVQLYGGSTANTILSNTANTYSGGTILGNGSGTTFTRILLSGTVGAGSPGAVTSGIFGTGAITMGSATTDRSQFYFAGATTINNAFVVNSAQGNGSNELGAFRSESTGVVLAGAINANLADATFNAINGTGRTINVTGAISGNSGLTVTAAGLGGLTVTLTNAGTANSYAGNTTISGNGNATLTLGRANQISNGAGKGNLIVTAGAFNMGGFSETINGLSGTGTVDGVSGTPTLTVGDNNATGADNTFSGVIKNTAGSLALTKTGSGTLTLSGTNTYTGATLISAGTLKLDATGTINDTSEVSLGTFGNLDITLKGLSGYTVGTLKGSGNVTGALTVSNQLAIGNSPGSTNFSSSLTLGAGSTYLYDLTGDAALGLNSADLGDVAGDLTITAGSILDLVQLGTYTANNKFTLFAYDGTFSGTFKDTFSNVLTDGATFTDAGGIWTIDYNDTTAGANGGVSASNTYVTITAIPEPNFAALFGGLGVLALLRRRR
jgi:fibronectin-binding autotransporter adhesin